MSETHVQLVYQYESVLSNSKELLSYMSKLKIHEVTFLGALVLTNGGFSSVATDEIIRSTKELTDVILVAESRGSRIGDPMSQINALYDLNVELKKQIHKLKKRIESDSLYYRDISKDIQNEI